MASKRLDRLPTYVFADLEKRILAAAKRVPVIDLGMSDPDRPPAPLIVDALEGDLRRPGHHLYQEFTGRPELRRAVSEWYNRRFGVRYDPEEVYITAGSKEAIVHLALALLDPGDVALIPDPGYPAYRAGVILAGGVVHPLPLRAENGYLPDLASLPEKVLRRTRLIYLNYPNNPTGAVAPRSFLKDAVRLCRERDVTLLYDHAYAEITYGEKAESPLGIPGAREVVLETFSFSKAFHLQGWRLGGVIGDAERLRAFDRLQSNIAAGVFRPVQAAGTAALRAALQNPEFFRGENRIFRERRDLAVDTLRRLGYRMEPPAGAVYLWFPVPEGWTAQRFVDLALQAGVALAPGDGFGEAGAGHVRLSLTRPTEELREGLNRLEKLFAREGLRAPQEMLRV